MRVYNLQLGMVYRIFFKINCIPFGFRTGNSCRGRDILRVQHFNETLSFRHVKERFVFIIEQITIFF